MRIKHPKPDGMHAFDKTHAFMIAREADAEGEGKEGD
jgi:hypothetical protein